MCEQCIAGASLVKSEALPGFSLMRAERGSTAWPKGWYGLVQSNDPAVVFPALVRDPSAALTPNESLAQGTDEDEQPYWDAVEGFNQQARLDPMTGYALTAACLQAGFNEATHGSNLGCWLIHHLASQLDQPSPERTTEAVLEAAGWVVECESPFEIRHLDGSFASGQAADMVVESLRTEQAAE